MTVTAGGLNTEVTAFEREGYVVVPGVLSRAEAEEAYAAFDALRPPGETRARFSANERAVLRHDAFLRVLTKPALHAALAAVFGDDLQLISYDSLETLAHAGNTRDWHADFSFRAPVTLTANCG